MKQYELDKNDAYPEVTRSFMNIIGKRPNDRPYLSVTFCNEKGQFAYAWMKDKDLERFAVNILKALKSKKLNHEHYTK